MLHKIDNGILEAVIESNGAELRSLRLIESDAEFMWEANPSYWGKSSPVLFPFVGGVKNGSYTYKGISYKGSKHGFARNREFKVVEHLKDKIILKLSSDEETLKDYPFEFDFYMTYFIDDNKLLIDYKVVNKTKGEMYFSLGSHPAFATPTNENIKFSDYYLEFEKEEKAQMFILDNSCLSGKKKDYLAGKKIELEKNTFIDDVVVFENLKSRVVSIKNDKNNRYIKVDYTGFPFIGFWNVPGADYVCIEPWCGIADMISGNGKLEEKYGIEKLIEGQNFSRVLKIEVGL